MIYTANPDELRKLAAGLRRAHAVVARLGRLPDGPGGAAGAVGSAAVARQLHEVSANWSSARRVLAGQLEALAAAADASALTYAGVEGELVRALGAP
jgi:hypothetical protein